MEDVYDLARAIFWSDRWRWPKNTRGKLFLGNVVHIMGQQLFDNQWREDAVSRRPILPPMPSHEEYLANPRAQLGAQGIASAIELLTLDGQWHRTEAGANVIFTSKEWSALQEIRGREKQHCAAGRIMWNEAIATLAKGFVSSDLPTFYQKHVAGGGFEPVDPECWILNEPSTLVDRFAFCSFSPAAPFEIPVNAAERRWIFVDGAALVNWRQKVAATFGQPVRGMPINLIGTPDRPSVSTDDSPRRLGLKEALTKAIEYLKNHNLSKLTRQEAHDLLEGDSVVSSSRRQRDTIIKPLIPAGTRRESATLSNRNNELDNCRRFLAATIMQD